MAGQSLRGCRLADTLDDLSRRRRDEQEFLSMMAHDLRTPLTAIRGYAQLAAKYAQGSENNTLRTGLETIVAQVDRLAALTEMLLDVARVQTGRMALRRTAVDLGRAARAAASRAGSAHPSVVVEAPASGPMISADRQRIDQIFTAFLEFALERSTPDTPILIRIAVYGDQARLDVEDGGEPLAAYTQARLFDDLVAVRRDGQAAGLGRLDLLVARGAAEAHGGQVEVMAPVPPTERGTRLTAWLPLSPPQRDPRPTVE
jgi:signal transduction histidine kinase